MTYPLNLGLQLFGGSDVETGDYGMLDDNYPNLTPREQQVLRLIAEGRNIKEIAKILVISEDTVITLKRKLFEKFYVHKLEELESTTKPIGYLPTPRYSLQEKIKELSNENVEIYGAFQSLNDYGQDKRVFYKLLISRNFEEIQRFKHGVDILGRIKHDNVLDVYDFGWNYGWDETERPFYTTQYYAPFDGILTACKDSPEKIDNFLKQILNVLGYLHWRGIIFNNLQPQNIFVASKQKVLLMDFGNSVILNKAPSSDGINEELKADIVSRISGESNPRRVDLQALGILIYQILTSDPHNLSCEPFTPEIGEQMIHDLRQQPADRAMARIVARLISVNPENCFQSAVDVTEALLRTKGSRFDQNRAFSKWVTGFSRMEPFGRSEVLEQLTSALRQLFEARRGGMYLIVGEAGIGKSAVLKQVRREARGFDKPEAILSDVKIAKKSSVSGGYMMWRDILRRLIEAAERNGLTGETARAIKSLQELLDPSVTTTPVMDSEGSTEQAALHLFRNLKAKKGIKNKVVVLLLDDLQRMGEDSFRLLQKLYKDIVRLNLPVLIIGSYKELDPDEDRMLNDLSRGVNLPSTAIIKLENLNQEASRQLSQHLLSTLNLQSNLYQVELDQLTQIISDKSRGFPLRVIRYVQVAAQYDRLDAIKAELDEIWSSEDESDREVVAWLQRNMYLNDESRLFLAKIAVIGIRVDIEVLNVIYPDDETLKSLLYACYDAGVLIGDNKQVKFQHDSVREAALKFLPEKAEKIYKEAALAIAKTYDANLNVHASQLAELWQKANERHNAAKYYLQAANYELSKSAYHAARDHAEKILYSELDAELPRLKRAEVKLIQYFAYMGLGEVDLALESAKNALDILGYKIITDSPFKLRLIRASLKQIWYRLREQKLTPKKSMNLDEYLEEFRIAVRCYRALAQLEYFRNNFWHVLYYLMEGLNLCDEVGDLGRGQKADLYAAAMVIASPLGPGILSKLIASQYEELAENDLDRSRDKTLELWLRLVLGMYYGSNGKWSEAKKHLERGMQLGKEGIDQRRRYEVVAILYICLTYSGEWDEAKVRNDYLRELVMDDKLSSDSLSQIDLWPQLFDGDKYLYMSMFKQGKELLEDACKELAKRDKAAWLRGMGVLTQIYLRSGEVSRAETTANEFFESVHGTPVMPFYAAEGFFGSLEVYLEILEDNVKSKDLRNKIEKLLYNLLDQPIIAYAKRYPIAKPRSLLYRARYVLITTSKKDRAKRLADLALRYARDLKMPYDEALALEFIGTNYCGDNPRCDDLLRAREIFKKLGATWNYGQINKRLK